MYLPRTVSFLTLGCKLNFAETASISRNVEKHGYAVPLGAVTTDIAVINTCSVTENADKKCKKLVQEILKVSPDTFIVIIGCYAQLKPVEIASIRGVDLVLGAQEKFKLAFHLDGLREKGKAKILNSPISEVKEFQSSWSVSERTRSFLKIQDGCNYSCSFCTIPLARGMSRNDSIAGIMQNARLIADQGISEIVLTGVNIGDFGHSTAENLLQLLHKLDTLTGIKRVRISSIEPNLLSEAIISFVATSRLFVPHFHIPLQSGSNKILAAMRRRYKKELYAGRIEYIKQIMPECAIGVDVIIGFPGETEADFSETYDFLKELDICYLHIFTYSERDQTHAVTLGDKVSPSVKQHRSAMLHILSDKKKMAFYEKYIGLEMDVLLETDHKKGLMHGFTANYLKVSVPFDEKLIKRMVRVRLLELDGEGAISGVIIKIYEIQAKIPVIEFQSAL